MKNWRPLLYFFSMLVLISLSCNLPGHDVLPQAGDVQEITSVSVTPHSGSGNFSAKVEGTTIKGLPAKLRCYVSDANKDVYGPALVQQYGTNSFEVSFTFPYTDPGTHSLVCLISDLPATAWSEDFVVVPPPTLTITASSATMTYGGTVPTITPAYSDFVAGGTASSLQTAPICSTIATSTSPVGSYPSSCSGAIDSNYTISYTDGSVNVTPAPLTIGAAYETMTEGGTVPTIAPRYYGFVAGDTESSLTSAQFARPQPPAHRRSVNIPPVVRVQLLAITPSVTGTVGLTSLPPPRPP